MKRKHPINPCKLENKVPELLCKPAMEHRLLRIFAHATPTGQYKALLFQIITSKDLTSSRCPHEEGNPWGSLHPPNTLPRKTDF